METMKAIVKLKPEPGIWMDRVPFPRIGHNDVLIKIVKTAICGTDIHIYNWDEWSQRTIPTPMAIGHEFVGIITDMGSEVRGLKAGDRVSAEGHITCGHCRNCRAGKRHLCRNTIGVGVNRPGCFAEYISVPASNVFKVPKTISDDIAAILDPFGNAAHTALSFDLVGEDVLITGAGPIGILAVAIARHVGARHVVITDVNDYRLELAERMGASAAINVTRTSIDNTVRQLEMKEGFDIGLEMSGNVQAFRDLLAAMNYGGRVAILGIPTGEVSLDLTQIILKGLKLKGIYGREMFETWYKMTSMLQSRLDISSVITHRFPVDDFMQAFDVMRSGQSGKVILEWV
ncbi:L-threonine 3-dehydrogenase [Desulfosarcina ovata subsp. ovata]|uniref:L-threonine 3-dehydrogenase n=2 Tax=Desulfosarcina ovata TaxID=83564 RepID=A0A5K8AIX3_9BACT|nr:L-threonine 3-dehydrogenase [Desulfosarcina ovata]BBO92611.1 L-threonine 3-dehydrogenase [Desulfosarcina ovata subsp. ovata]